MYGNPHQLMMGQFMPMLHNGATLIHRNVGNDAEKSKADGIGNVWKNSLTTIFCMLVWYKFHLKSIILNIFVQSNKFIFNLKKIVIFGSNDAANSLINEKRLEYFPLR